MAQPVPQCPSCLAPAQGQASCCCPPHFTVDSGLRPGQHRPWCEGVGTHLLPCMICSPAHPLLTVPTHLAASFYSPATGTHIMRSHLPRVALTVTRAEAAGTLQICAPSICTTNASHGSGETRAPQGYKVWQSLASARMISSGSVP